MIRLRLTVTVYRILIHYWFLTQNEELKMQKIPQIKKIGQIPFFLMSLMNPKVWGPLIHAHKRTRFDHDFSVSWSQCGEDLALIFLLEADKKLGTYVDVGAHHPDRFSVTRALYEKGWSGINIDADDQVRDAFVRRRPRDKFFVGAVGTNDYYDFYRSEEKAISTVRRDWMERYANAGFRFEEKKRVKGIKLRSILESMPTRVDLLNVDIEGADLDAIKSIEFDKLNENLWPEWIMVESYPPLETALLIESIVYLISREYKVWAMLPMVTILRRTSN